MSTNAKLSAYLAAESTTATAWLAVARRVLAGDYRRADRSTREAIVIGLSRYNGEESKKAIRIIEGIL